MKVKNGLAPVAQRLGFKIRKAPVCTGAAILAGSMLFCGSAAADEVAFDDFNDLILEPFSVASEGSTEESAYDGWTAMDVDSWTSQQGVQLGRTSLGSGTNNTALVADPDAWDDFTPAQPLGYNSFISREYNLAGFNVSTLEINFDYEFASYDVQRGTVEVSFDNGATWDVLLDLDSGVIGNSVLVLGPATFNAGVDFVATSSTMLLRVGCTNADNDWWFALDNIAVTTSDGFSDVEDFEGLPLEPFVVAGGGDGTDWTNQIRTGSSRAWTVDNSGMLTGAGDGTDFTQSIPNWTIDNSGNLGFSEEQAYDGWSAIDVASWIEEQGGQGRTLFSIEDPNNIVLVADGDAFYDYDFDLMGNPGAPPEAVNSYISRFFDLSNFDSTTIDISFEYEFRIDGTQVGVAEVSFDSGNTFTRLLELDVNDGAPDDILANFAVFTAGTDFPAVASNSMILRFGYLMADNNWWFAVDNITVNADPGTFVIGDINGDGVVNLSDVAPFVDVISSGTFLAAADINQDGQINLSDVAPFVQLLSGG